ncbi:ATP-dependent chaperone protein ClpB [compost metagenome]
MFGARPLKRAIQQQIENPVARAILEGKFTAKDVVPVDYVDGEFTFGRALH